MTATNHALTGAVIAAALPIPWLALPLALASHVVIDAVPHYADDALEFSSRKFKTLLLIDAVMCLGLAAVIILLMPQNWLLIIACALVAAAPDALWLPDFLAARNGKPRPQYGKLRNFLSNIQWSQKRLGIVVELAWFGSFFAILGAYLFVY